MLKLTNAGLNINPPNCKFKIGDMIVCNRDKNLKALVLAIGTGEQGVAYRLKFDPPNKQDFKFFKAEEIDRNFILRR